MSENAFRKSYEIVAYDVLAERVRQTEKWGKQDFSPLEWLPILTEEVGEVAKAICEIYHGHRQGIATPRTNEYRMELVQVAAVAIQMIENLDEEMKEVKHDES